MKLAYPIALILPALLLPVAALAQGMSPAVTVAPINTVVVARGGKAPLNIEMRVNRGFHVNSHEPHDELLLPTVVHLNPPEGILIMNIQYPEGEELALPFMGNEKLSVYSQLFTVSAEVRIPKSAALGTLRVHGDVKYQACDNRQCFPPKTTPLEFDVKVVRPAVKKKPAYNPASPHIHQ
jgi:DsbC/DsbD-like thiol-disulfide interchange protein